MMRASPPVREVHVALIGMRASGKSALAVKYIARRFIGEYDPDLEDTYCRQDTVQNENLMVWLMDTVETGDRDRLRYMSWADVYVVVYDITNAHSMQYAESLMVAIAGHEHKLCMRKHVTILVGNKRDLERYRAVSEADGERLAKRHGALFCELSATDEHSRVATALIHRPIIALIVEHAKQRSPSPRLYSSDSELAAGSKAALKTTRRQTSSQSSRRSKSPKGGSSGGLVKSKSTTGSKLLKLFHN